MISSATSSSVSALPQPASAADNAAPSSSSDQDSPASFSDVMNQQQGSSRQPEHARTPPATPAQPQTPAAPPVASAKGGHAKSAPAAHAPTHASLLVQAAVAASNAPAAKATSATTASTLATSTETDLDELIAQATALLSTRPQVVTGKAAPATPSTSSDKSAKDSGSSPKTSTPPSSPPIDLSTLIVQTSILAQTTPAITGKDLPSVGLTAAAVGSAGKEKKSASTSVGGSFLQSGPASTSALASAFGMLSVLQAVTSGAAVSQQLTSKSGPENDSIRALAATTAATAGTANVEKEKAMSTESNISEMTLLSGNGGNAVSSQSSADLHIQLASNSDFTDALKQVMHVAQLTQTRESRTPMRVEMEIQTPPGAVVNVYVSKQNDGWRAQLSTNDPVALAWVQNQVASLRQSSDLGVEVKWLPPQLESGTTITTSGGQESNLAWNQGGQNQSGYQQPDERQQPGQQQNPDASPELVSASNQFMNTLSALGRAA